MLKSGEDLKLLKLTKNPKHGLLGIFVNLF